MTVAPSPPDEAARQTIRSALDATLFVEAGAGSGKTSALVERVLALVDSGAVELRSIAAITFTDKAGDELRDRLRRAIEGPAATEEDPARRARYRLALDQLDGAAIGTLHSFAQRLLSEHPVEAGLPPRVEVLDEVSSDVAFAQRWAMFQDELLADDAFEETLLLFFASGVRPDALRVLARAFDDNWDLVEEHVDDAPGPVPSARALLAAELQELRRLCASQCHDPDDGLRRRLDDILLYVQGLADAPDDVALLEALDPERDPKPPSFRVKKTGKATAWDDVDQVRDGVRRAGECLAGIRDRVAQACAHQLAAAVRRFTLDAAGERRRAGQLQFHDLLVFSRALLRDPAQGPAVRARLHERYQRILLDEFQDTDPIQIELAVRIAAAQPLAASAGSEPWDRVDVAPGHLFVVGDPKQSIYRFRRADISTFLAAQGRFGERTGGLVRLTANFRTTAPVIEWVNATFAALMHEAPDVPTPVPSQPEYAALAPTRAPAPVGPAVSVLGRASHAGGSADDLRAAEAAEVAAAVATAVAEGWTVCDRSGEWRPARLGDVTVLVPARTSLPFLEDALARAGIAYRAESSSLVYATRAVRDLLMVLRAVDDPTDQLAVVSALRSALLGCGDDDLFRFKVERAGRFGYLGDQPPTVPADDPVARGLAYLRALHDDRHWLAPSELLGRIVRDRRVLELGFADGRPRDLWRRVRFVVDQARAWTEATGGNLRQYLSWVAYQASEGARVSEAVLPETDDDAVRIMTIHSAKGLEFPVVVVSGMSTAPRGRSAAAQVSFQPDGTVGYRFGRHLVTREFEEFVPVDEQMALDERKRLLYVACTRARDHLVVSLHRKVRVSPATGMTRTNAELLLQGMGDEVLAALPDAAGDVGALGTPAVAPPAAPPDFDRWQADRAAALARAGRRSVVAATALTDEGGLDVEEEPDPGLDKRPRDLDLPPWLKGRYGSAVGRAVHGVLQTIDLGTGAGMEDAVAAQCEAEAVVERTEVVEHLVRAALGAPSVRAAASAPHWRELYVCTPVEGRLLEGYVDLLYRSAEGLVVVDFKTSASDDPAELARRVEGYRNQGASYALAVSEATGEPVVRVVFLFLTPSGAVELELDELARSTAHVGRLVGQGHEAVLP